MNNPSPLVPQGSLLEQKNKSRARVRLAVFVVLSVHIVGLVALLMQGCKKPPEAEPAAAAQTNDFFPAFDATNTPETAVAPGTNTSNMTALPTSLPDTNTSPMAVQPGGTGQEYTVAKGDSFSTIAPKFGVTVRQLQEANPKVQPTKLQIGQKLQIPAPTVVAPTTTNVSAPDAAAGTAQTYKVKSGDNLIKIAGQFGVTVRALRSANNLTTDRITVGQTLKIPAKAAATTTTTPTP